jgi:hypothetical protein
MTPDFDTSLEGQVSFLYVSHDVVSVGLCPSHRPLETYPTRVLMVSPKSPHIQRLNIAST